jgi:two-component system osmolarity sensor histidine kinase EnvZ
MLNDLKSESDRLGFDVTVAFDGDPMVTVKPTAFKRLVANLVVNGARYADRVAVQGRHASGWLTITVDDDGPGVPPEERENVFRPFYRLDQARNQDEGGTGLGLAIARDIARGHGGDIRLEESPLGGLRAVIRVPG